MASPIREHGKKRVLVVDDVAIILSRVTDALEKQYGVVTVNSASRALEYLSANKPDLILLDIRMPGQDGFELLRQIKTMEDRADIPVMVLTGLEEKQYVVEGLSLGIRDYILKPFAPNDLLERVQRVLEPGV